jgi:hypothetical protein
MPLLINMAQCQHCETYFLPNTQEQLDKQSCQECLNYIANNFLIEKHNEENYQIYTTFTTFQK